MQRAKDALWVKDSKIRFPHFAFVSVIRIKGFDKSAKQVRLENPGNQSAHPFFPVINERVFWKVKGYKKRIYDERMVMVYLNILCSAHGF